MSNKDIYKHNSLGEIIEVENYGINSIPAGSLELVSTTHYGKKSEVISLNEISGFTARVYPNPVSNYLIIELDEHQDIISIEIRDLSGKLTVAETGIKAGRVDVSSLQKGTYLLTITASDKVWNSKLVKQ